ncbi:hypothetical protein [Pseudonocardia cypriaca]|uniref:Uncharacterized protein n=1 Tax=Pseudonocardia cypriaca TaxID=882449 RepID=A0A543FWF5_9PSEU|nr:hypothetical protein [Pseudonocardia cypriaca]TQM38162.1 hypothetical protein FB388_5389 [Pseudonocardia cypriaca]
MSAGIVHFTPDAYPRVVAGPAGALDVLLPFRIDTDEPNVPIVAYRLRAEVDGRSWTPRARMRHIREGFANWMRHQMRTHGQFRFEHMPYYVGLDDRLRGGHSQYLEARLPAVPAGARITYSLEVTTPHGELHSADHTTVAVAPDFTREDIRRIFIPQPGGALDAWVLYHRRTPERDEIRVDVVDLFAHRQDGRPDLAVQIGDRMIDLRTPQPDPLPLVDISADSVTVAVPRTGDDLPPVVVTHHGRAVDVDLAAPAEVGSARVVFVNFAIQGLNDLFATADDDYTPPKTYAQVTMRDPGASYSSRPGSKESNTGDGYAFTLDAHRHYGIPQMWAMNGGLLDLLAHDCPEDLERMRQDVRDGLLVPVVAGFGAHRLPYYTAATNLDAITLGSDAMREIVGETRPVYYPDSRIVTDRPNVVEALQKAGVEYLVVDGGHQENGEEDTATVVRSTSPAMGRETDGRWVNWQYLWRDRTTGLKVLFIDPEMKDRLLGASDHDADRGKVDYDLRRKFIELAAQPQLRRGNLLVYSDDADKASGNGWFDGVYNGNELQFNQKYQAALSWLAAHPWVQVVTTDDLGDADCVGDLDLVRASDPYIEKEWELDLAPVPGHDFGLAFDTWYTAWARIPAAWLGEDLEAISKRAERAIASCQADCRNQLFDLARLYFTLNLHESQWSKRARVPEDRPGGTEPEDFVAAESLQLRNTHVYLAAAIWAAWAQRGPDSAFRDAGPVVDRVAELEDVVDRGTPPPWRRARGLHWDHDPLPSVVLYNAQALAVLDRNGGRITHLFSLVDGRPYAVSGTCKAYQFLDMDWASDSGVQCDGIVLQNTVWTPNHAYVACDVDPSQGTTGTSPAGDDAFDWYYPDNFNAYDEIPGGDAVAVTFEYGDGSPLEDAPDNLQALDDRLAEDHRAKRAGERGVVLHDVDAFGRFRKTVRLDGRVVHVAYTGTLPGHRVANEFCVDLWASAMQGRRQTATVAPDGRSAEVVNEAGLAVRLELGSGCEFSAAARAPQDEPTVETLRLHRVMTDDLEIVAPAGGNFDYRIVLPG